MPPPPKIGLRRYWHSFFQSHQHFQIYLCGGHKAGLFRVSGRKSEKQEDRRNAHFWRKQVSLKKNYVNISLTLFRVGVYWGGAVLAHPTRNRVKSKYWHSFFQSHQDFQINLCGGHKAGLFRVSGRKTEKQEDPINAHFWKKQISLKKNYVNVSLSRILT